MDDRHLGYQKKIPQNIFSLKYLEMLERKNGIKSSRNLPAFEIPILIGNGCQIREKQVSAFFKSVHSTCSPQCLLWTSQ